MKAPDFWNNANHPLSRLLAPVSVLYYRLGRLRWRITTPYHAGVPVICVGNLVAGGAGKTPVVMMLANIASELGFKPHVISRGYGGSIRHTTQVQPERHSAADVGDEPLLIAHTTPCWISADRKASAQAAVQAGATLLIMDDGFQNPQLHKDLSIIVIDGDAGIGNGKLIPAGPLREPVQEGLKRADAIMFTGQDSQQLIPQLPKHLHLFRGRISPDIPKILKDKPLYAFAGIGRPAKFFTMLQHYNLRVRETRSFPDHHLYSETELQQLKQEAEARNATLVTTEKDWMRLSEEWKTQITPIPITFHCSPEEKCKEMIAKLSESAHSS